MNRRQEHEIPIEAYLTESNKQLLLVGLVRNRVAFDAVRARLRPDHFGRQSLVPQILWAAVLHHHAKFDNLPNRTALQAQVNERLAADHVGRLSRKDGVVMAKLMKRIFRYPESDIDIQWTVDAARRLMQEEVQSRIQDSMATPEGMFSDLPALLQGYAHEIETIRSVGQIDETDPFSMAELEKMESLAVESTGLPFLDHFMEGGHAPGEVYTVVAGSGSGKTTLAVQIAAEGAKSEYAKWRRAKGKKPLGVWLFISYEAVLEELRVRALAYVAQVDKVRLERSHGLRGLSTTANLQDYERRWFAKEIEAGESVSGEYERIQAVSKMMGRTFRVRDMNQPGRGINSIDEVAAYVRMLVASSERPLHIAGIVVDWAGVCVQRYMAHHGLAMDKMRHYLSSLPDQARSLLAIPFQCKVWIFHQLAGREAKRPSTKTADHTDAAECKNFSDFAAFGFVLARPDTDGLAALSCSKQRRSKREFNTVVRLEGRFGKFSSVEDFVPDPATRKFISRENASVVSLVNLDGLKPKKSSRKPEAYSDNAAGLGIYDTDD